MNYRNYSLAIANSIIQYFNYAIFSISALELSKAFMPGLDQKDQLVNFFSYIILTVLARPLGSIIFGNLGDKKGRKLAIISAGIISSLGTIAVSFTPIYSQIGLYSAFMFLFARMIFLSGLSGEIDGIRIYISEVVSKKYINFSNGLITFLTQSGALMASICIYIFSGIENNWRICFFIGGTLGLLFSGARWLLPESTEYKTLNEDHPSQYYKISFFQILFGQPLLFIQTIIISGTIGALYQFYIIFLPAFASLELNISLKDVIPFCILSYGIGGAFFGFLADRYKGYSLFFSLVLIILNLILLSYALYFRIESLIGHMIIIASFLSSSFSVPAQVFIRNRINIAIRYRLFSLSHSIGSLIFSTTTPFISSLIANKYGLFYAPFYLLLCLVVTIFSVIMLKCRADKLSKKWK